MKKEFVTYEIDLKLKELGFDEECIGVFDRNGKISGIDFIDISNLQGINYSCISHNYPILAPLYQQAIDWIREKYNISLEIFTLSYHNSIQYCFNIKKLEDTTISVLHKGNIYYPSYYEAREQGILKAIELVEKNYPKHL